MPDVRRARLPRSLSGFTRGLLQVPASFVYLLKRPALWSFSVLPAVATVVLVGAGLAGGYWLGPAVTARVIGDESVWSSIPRVGLHVAVVFAGAFAGLAVALLLTAPFQELLSQRVEKATFGELAESARGWRWEIAQTVRGALYFLLRAPFVLLLGFVPVAGPPLALLWAAHSLALQQTDVTLARHGLDFETRRDWHRQHRFESIGFGVGGLLTLLIPVANLLLMPVLVVGATRLALALLPEETGIGDSHRSRRRRSSRSSTAREKVRG